MVEIKQVVKRDGRIVPFDKDRIATAIFKAAVSVGGNNKRTAEVLAGKVIKAAEKQFEGQTPTVEQLQDVIEKILIEEGHAKTSKAFILYREQRAKLRDMKNIALDIEGTIDDYLGQNDWRVKENSNEQYSFSGLLLYTAGKVIANYMLNKVYTPDVSEAHKKGYIHIHDLSHGIIGYCAGWSLRKLLEQGFGGVTNKVEAKPAKHLGVVVHQMVNFIGCLQMEFAGAQAFSSVDTFLAPFAKEDKLDYKQVKQEMQKLIFSLNIPSRWGSQYPFSNLTFDLVCPEDLKNEKAIVGGKELLYTYGDCQKEMDMINKGFLEVMLEGDAKGAIFTFPIPTYNITKEFNWDSENANLLFEMTAKYGTPYFQNYIGSGLDPRSIRSMCCRLQMNMNELVQRPGHTFAMGDATGSIGVVTLNLNRLGYESKNKEEFFAKVKYYMTIAKESLEVKRKIVNNNLKTGLMPYTKVYLGTFRNHFSTIGLCGMNEACLNLLGKDILSPEGKQLTIETLTVMREMTRQFQIETSNLYNLEATPAEGASYRLAKSDRDLYPDIITSGKNAPYLTNSTQIPVDATDDIIEAIEHQNDIQPLYTGGTVFHTFLGERMASGEAAKKLVKKIAFNTRIPYFTITPTFSLCPEHGYVSGEHFNCPNAKQASIAEARQV